MLKTISNQQIFTFKWKKIITIKEKKNFQKKK